LPYSNAALSLLDYRALQLTPRLAETLLPSISTRLSAGKHPGIPQPPAARQPCLSPRHSPWAPLGPGCAPSPSPCTRCGPDEEQCSTELNCRGMHAAHSAAIYLCHGRLDSLPFPRALLLEEPAVKLHLLLHPRIPLLSPGQTPLPGVIFSSWEL